VNIHGNNYEVNINRTHNAQSGIDIGNGGNANHPREMTIDMYNNEPLNKFCWLSNFNFTIGKWEKAPETDNLIALQGTIYSTSMYCAILTKYIVFLVRLVIKS
jgi:hypothetical protein